MKILYRAVYKEPDKLGLRKSEVIKEGHACLYDLKNILELEGYTGRYCIEAYKV